MFQLPSLRYIPSLNAAEIPVMRSVNFSDAFSDGDIAESRNVSARRYPYLSTRHKRVQQSKTAGDVEVYADVTALTAREKLITVKGTSLYYDGSAVAGSVTADEKQFAVVNTKLVIWPDKKYLDMSDINNLKLMDLAATATATGATFTTDTVTYTGTSVDLTQKFKIGDVVTLTGSSVAANNKDILILALTSSSITTKADAFTAAATASGTYGIERKTPDMDYICEADNRLWGCSSSKQTIYASALGDPTNFYVYEGLATDSYAVAVGSAGAFTGCIQLQNSVLFWKENTLHKMLGSYPAEYTLYDYTVEGLKAGCNKSLQVVNEVLYYMGAHGVYAYTGGTPQLISLNFGGKEFSAGVAGSDGDSYFLSGMDKNNEWHLLVYETHYGIWVQEDTLHCVDFARIGINLYFLDSDGNVWLEDGGVDEEDLEWHVQYCPFYETISGRKGFSKLRLRTELPRKSYVRIYVRQDGGPWREAGRIVGRDNDVTVIRVPLTRCDKYEIRIEGKGPCAILSVQRIFSIRSEV